VIQIWKPIETFGHFEKPDADLEGAVEKAKAALKFAAPRFKGNQTTK
jgi:hypothetical protein